jgi:hypothetical protein
LTIEKGQPWGHPGRLPPAGVAVRSDAEAAAIVRAARDDGDDPPTFGLLGGDLCRTVGGRGDEERLHSADAMTLPVDLGTVVVDGTMHVFVAHLVLRRSWWRGPVVAVMNAEWLGTWDVAPRAHPNDGRLDVVEGDLSLDDRLKARTRLATGTHVPHPGINERRVVEVRFDLPRATPVWLDGVRLCSARTLAVRLEPDALTCVV